MKNFTIFCEYLIKKSIISKQLLLFTALCCVLSVNAQLRLVKDCRTGTQSSYPNGFFEFDGKLMFSASYTFGVRQLWVSDGTTAGTVPMSNQISPTDPPFTDYIDGTPVDHVIIGNNLYFEFFLASSTNNQDIYQIYNVTSGSNNVQQFANGGQAFPGLTSFRDRFYNPIVLGNNIVFTPALSIDNNSEPVVVNVSGTASVLKEINTSGGSSPSDFILFNNSAYFSADDGVNGRELWKTNGTTAGTILSLDINAGSISSNPDNFNVIASGTQLTFAATYSGIGRELFKSNGNTLILISNINPGGGSSNPTNITNIDDTLYFSANNGSVGYELWKSNGFNSGTTLIKDINSTGDSDVSNFTKVGSDIYFTANDGINGIELWKTDGTNAGTILVKDINTSGSSNPSFLTEYNGNLYFSANEGSDIELWMSDGTNAGTVKIDVNSTGNGQVNNLYVFGDELFFAAISNSGIGAELHAYKDPALSNKDFELESKISLFPNPSSSYFKIKTNSQLNAIDILNINGQIVKSFQGTYKQYDIEELTSGLYFVNIKTEKGEIIKKMIKK